LRGPARPLAPRLRRSAAAASASRLAPIASSSPWARRARSTAIGGSDRARLRASSSRARAASSGRPAPANASTARSSKAGADGSPVASNTRPRASAASASTRLRRVAAAIASSCAAASPAASIAPDASRASTRRASSGTASTFDPLIWASRRSASVAAASGSAREAEVHRRVDRLGLVREVGEQPGGLVEASLQDSDLREPRGRMNAAGTLPRRGQLAQRRNKLSLSVIDAPVGRRDVGAAGAAEREQRHVVVCAHERLEDLAPLLRSLVVACELAREY